MGLAARKIGTYPTGSPEWHAARRGKMSGSRIAAAAGMSPWESPFSLWHRMAGNIGEQDESPQMMWGTILEAPVGEHFARLHPEWRVNRKPGTWLANNNDWMLANPDGLISLAPRRRPEGVLEIKTSAYLDGWGQEGTDQIPIHYYCQVIWYLHTLGLKWAYVAVLFGGNDYREFYVEYNSDAADELVTIGWQFMESLRLDVPPDLDGQPATMVTIKEMHPDIDGTSVDIPDWLGWQLTREKSRLIVPVERFDTAKAELAQFMGPAQRAFWDPGDGKGSRKIADRRSKNGGTPYIQVAASNLPTPTQVPDNREAAKA